MVYICRGMKKLLIECRKSFTSQLCLISQSYNLSISSECKITSQEKVKINPRKLLKMAQSCFFEESLPLMIEFLTTETRKLENSWWFLFIFRIK